MTITLRSEKGAALSHAEMDGNFTDLNTNKAALADLAASGGSSLLGFTQSPVPRRADLALEVDKSVMAAMNNANDWGAP